MISFSHYSKADLLAIVSAQVHEMDLVRRKIYELEQAQQQIKAKYAGSSSPLSAALH
jgi:hypothetical protein